jgi:hypothetical protein
MLSLNSAAGVDPGKTETIAGRPVATSTDARAALTAATSAAGSAPRPPPGAPNALARGVKPVLGRASMEWDGVEKRLKVGGVSPVV